VATTLLCPSFSFPLGFAIPQPSRTIVSMPEVNKLRIRTVPTRNSTSRHSSRSGSINKAPRPGDPAPFDISAGMLVEHFSSGFLKSRKSNPQGSSRRDVGSRQAFAPFAFSTKAPPQAATPKTNSSFFNLLSAIFHPTQPKHGNEVLEHPQ